MRADNVTAQPIPGSTTYRDSPMYLGTRPHDLQAVPDLPARLPERLVLCVMCGNIRRVGVACEKCGPE